MQKGPRVTRDAGGRSGRAPRPRATHRSSVLVILHRALQRHLPRRYQALVGGLTDALAVPLRELVRRTRRRVRALALPQLLLDELRGRALQLLLVRRALPEQHLVHGHVAAQLGRRGVDVRGKGRVRPAVHGPIERDCRLDAARRHSKRGEAASDRSRRSRSRSRSRLLRMTRGCCCDRGGCGATSGLRLLMLLQRWDHLRGHCEVLCTRGRLAVLQRADLLPQAAEQVEQRTLLRRRLGHGRRGRECSALGMRAHSYGARQGGGRQDSVF